MPQLLLGPLLRFVDETSATIWVETSEPCEVVVCGHGARTFTVAGHHYALVIVEGLAAGSTTPYDVQIDGRRVWPEPDSALPAPVIRTHEPGSDLRILFGSCRAAAPHEEPWNLELELDERGRGIDAMRERALAMLDRPPDEWPHLLVLLGDQVYADDSSPVTRARIADRRAHLDDSDLTPAFDEVADFEEYTWLYHESWRPEVERWLLSVVPSVMIFDDHDMVDDWNISQAWVDDIRRHRWWHDHVIGGVMAYWIYQHLGNLGPDDIRRDGMLDDCVLAGDATDLLREWAMRSEKCTPVPGGYRFSYCRDLGRTRLIVIDCRNGRVLEPGNRLMVGDDEWAWVRERAMGECDHLLIATSVPVLMPGGLHELEVWNEAVCDGAWGTRFASVGERIRRAIDLEDWPAFRRSFDRFVDLLRDVATPDRPDGARPPSTISILSGDVHFTYGVEGHFDPDPARPAPVSAVHQLVCSPMRNALVHRERAVIRAAVSTPGRVLGSLLRRLVRAPRPALRWDRTPTILFNNAMARLEISGQQAEVELHNSGDEADRRIALHRQR